ncbi:hypothetical protein DICSQDRAFT_57409, partial [Dichomitus squalens LYAD-421 SS1]|uniref:uncharacterized protein n=1 Tax=Dichomitus squalens (strain LYAD-421) TaxID=732165 RepID=UPI00044134AA
APGGFKVCRLSRLRWAALDDNAFRFVSPDQILRGAHLMPAFAHGQSDRALPGYSVAHKEEEEDTDWNYHYVGIFADRDIFMQYYGGAVGHQRGQPGKRHPALVAPEPITPLTGDSYDDEIGDKADNVGTEAWYDAQEHLLGSDGEDSDADEHLNDGEEDEDLEDDNEGEGKDNDDDAALGSEDGETPLGDDELELARMGFAAM